MPRWKRRGIFDLLWSALTCQRFGNRRPVAAVLSHTGLSVSRNTSSIPNYCDRLQKTKAVTGHRTPNLVLSGRAGVGNNR